MFSTKNNNRCRDGAVYPKTRVVAMKNPTGEKMSETRGEVVMQVYIHQLNTLIINAVTISTSGNILLVFIPAICMYVYYYNEYIVSF